MARKTEPLPRRRPGPRPARRRLRGHQTPRRGALPEQTRDLFDVIERGAVMRRYRLFSELVRMMPAALVSGLLQCALYIFIVTSAGRYDWANTLTVCAVLLVMPPAATLVLAAVRNREFPFLMSALVMTVVYNFGIVVLSALRVPVSYSALLWTALIAIAGMVIAATRLTRLRGERLAILDFDKAREVAETIGGDITIITGAEPQLEGFDRILIDGTSHHTPQWNSYLTRAQMHGILVQPWFSVLEQKWGWVDSEQFDITHLAYSPTQIYYTRIKRGLDLLLLVLTLPLTVPVGVFVWAYIRIVDGGPSLFVQTRRGYGGRRFRMLKFRTMRKGTHGGQTGAADARILPGCHFLRRYRLDELPQLINIWRGEMSWIGPRPMSLEIARQCEQISPAYTARYLVLPGITGWAQVQFGYTSSVEEEFEKLGYDLYYLKRISLDLDLEITFRTIRTLITRDGAR